MNYLIRESRLWDAIRDYYKERPKEEKDAEYDKVNNLFIGLSREFTNSALRGASRMLGESVEDDEDPVKEIFRKMREVNGMCSQYGVDPVFPEAEGRAKRSEIADALKEYMDQVMAVDRHSHDALGKAIEAHDFGEYERLCNYLTENVEEILEKDRADRWD